MPLWMYGYGWQMAFWMLGGILTWIVLVAIAAWIIARWLTRTLERLDSSLLRLLRAQNVHGTALDTEITDEMPAYPSPGDRGNQTWNA